MSTHRPPPRTPLVDDYLAAAPIGAVHVLGADGGNVTKFVASSGKKPMDSLPQTVQWHGAYWCVGSLLAEEIAKRCYALIMEGRFAFRGAWCEFPALSGWTIVERSAEHMDIRVLPDAEARRRALIEVRKINKRFDELEEVGAFRIINQEYKKMRLAAATAGRPAPTYEAYLFERRRSAVRKEAQRLGAQVMAAGDLRHDEPIEVPE